MPLLKRLVHREEASKTLGIEAGFSWSEAVGDKVNTSDKEDSLGSEEETLDETVTSLTLPLLILSYM